MKQKILLIDDEELVIKSISKLLTKEGYDALLCRSGNEAIKTFKSEAIDLILCDVRMPGKNGVETIREIRSIPEKGETIPVIFLTGYADKQLEQEAQTLNPVAYVFKPFDALNLLELIGSTLVPAKRNCE